MEIGKTCKNEKEEEEMKKKHQVDNFKEENALKQIEEKKKLEELNYLMKNP